MSDGTATKLIRPTQVVKAKVAFQHALLNFKQIHSIEH